VLLSAMKGRMSIDLCDLIAPNRRRCQKRKWMGDWVAHPLLDVRLG